MDSSDKDILARVQRGERDAFVHLFDRHYARVERYALQRLQHKEAARDVASETFLRAYRSVDGFRLDSNISYLGYLLLICRRLTLTELERRRKASLHSLDTAGIEQDRFADTAPLPLALLLERETAAALQEAMRLLSTDDREIIHLAFEKDLSRRDIMEIMGKPSIGAVTSHLYRALQKLKEIVQQQHYFTVDRQTETA